MRYFDFLPGLVVLGFSLLSNLSQAQDPSIRSEIINKKVTDNKLYGYVEMRHHYNSYYDTQGYVSQRVPVWHARIQAGMSFYDQKVDVYGTLGVYKETQTQQIKQRRPEFAVDFKPFHGDWFKLIQYNQIKIPVEDLTTEDGDPLPRDQQGTIYVMGLNPELFYGTTAGPFRVIPRVGVDMWTKFYSRPQQVVVPEEEDFTGYERDAFSLVSYDQDDAETETIEDYANYYYNQAQVSIDVAPLTFSALSTEIGAYYHNAFFPKYSRVDEKIDYSYGASRTTFLRWRLNYRIHDNLLFINDLYSFYRDRFASLQTGEDRRYRNISRIVWRL